MSHDPQKQSDPSESPPPGGSQSGLPKDSSVYQIGYKPFEWQAASKEYYKTKMMSHASLYSLSPKTLKTLLDEFDKIEKVSLDLETPSQPETSSASPDPSPAPPPTVTLRTICRPLDLRRGAEIRLTEEEVQLAMSQAPVAGPSSRPPNKSSVAPKAVSAYYTQWNGPDGPPCWKKPLMANLYKTTRIRVKYILNPDGSVKEPTKAMKWATQWVNRQEYFDRFQVYEKAWLELQNAQSPSEPPF
jgi:hypothetical protein